MDLVTVTCNKDLDFMFLQAKSVGNFLAAGTKHWILVNEPKDSLYKYNWSELLSHYYRDQLLEVVYLDSSLWNQCKIGWAVQQVQKLKAVEIVNDDYLILDSKNFLTSPINLDNWKHDGSGVLISKTDNLEVWNHWDSVNTQYSLWLKQPKLETYYAIETPFVIQKNIAKAAISVEHFERIFFDFYATGFSASEFIYYSYFLRAAGHEFSKCRRHYCLWDRNNLSDWFSHEEFSTMEISGIHRDWFLKSSSRDKQHLISWLKTFDLIDQHTLTLFS